jgi:hypothetical protein
MKVTILSGALAGDDFIDSLHDMLAAQLTGQDHQVQTWTLREEKIAFCLGCFECWTKYPGLCRIDDTGREVTESIINSDLVIYLSPVTFGGYSSELKKALDRSICLIMPFFTRIQGEVHHVPRYESYPRLLAIGVLPAHDLEQERLFSTLLNCNAINMHAPANAAGFIYRSQKEDSILPILERLLAEIGLSQSDLVVLEGME